MSSMVQAQPVEQALAPDTERVEQHELSLLLGGRCRACAELLPRGAILRGEPCPLCREPTALAGSDRAFIVKMLSHRANVRVGMLALAIGLSHLLIGWVPVVSSLVIAASTAWIRFQVVQPAARLLSPARGRVAVWTARVATSAFVAGTLIVNELVTLLPFAGAVTKGFIAAGEVLVVAWVNAAYMRWQLRRDEQGAKVGWWEYGLLVLSFGVLIGSAIGLVAAAMAVMVAAQAVAERLIQ